MSREEERPTFGTVRHLAVMLAVGLSMAAASRGEDLAPQTPAPEGRLKIYTTFYPTTYFAERIGAGSVAVVCPCPAGVDPAWWMPDDKIVQAYQQADLIIINGASFEKWLDKVTLPESRLVDTTRPLADEFIMLSDAVTHSHGPRGTHSHAGIDGHTWLDPVNAKIQAGQIKEALVKRLPDHRSTFEQGYAALASDLDALNSRLKALTANVADQTLLNSHPAYNYLARRYGWRVKYFHLDPATMPDSATLSEIGVFLEHQPAKYLLWESEPSAEIAARLREVHGLESIVWSPCESLEAKRIEDGEDFLSVMNANVDRLQKALGK